MAMNRSVLKTVDRWFPCLCLAALFAMTGCAHEQGYDIGRLGDPPVLPALNEHENTGELSSDRFLQLVDRNSWPRTVIAVPRALTIHDPSYMTEARFEREGQPWEDHPTLASAQNAAPGRGDDTGVLLGELFQGAVDIVLMPFRMIIGPHPHDAINGPATDWALLPHRAAFDPGWFHPMGTAEAPIPFDDNE